MSLVIFFHRPSRPVLKESPKTTNIDNSILKSSIRPAPGVFVAPGYWKGLAAACAPVGVVTPQES